MLRQLAMEALWSGMAALGAQILFLAVRTRLGAGYAWFAAALLAMAALFAVPVWFPSSMPPDWMPAITYGLTASGLFCVAGLARLLRRYLDLHGANRETMENLAAAFVSLRESAGVTALGASAASISHEIRNYAATLRGNAVLMRHDMDSDGYRAEVDRIRATAEKLEAVSRDIAVYSDSALATGKTRFALDGIARACARDAFPDRAGSIRIGSWPAGSAVRGDAGKLERVFLNLFRNAFEAGAGSVEVRFRIFGSRLVVVVEDDGQGCLPGDLERLAVPFFSGKDAGTGLGCAIAVSTLAGHGASFRAYARNALPDGGTGLILNLVFPWDGAKPVEATAMPVVSVDASARAGLIAPLVNLGIQPVYVAWDGADSVGSGFGMPLLAEASVVPRLSRGWPHGVLAVDSARTASWIGGPAEDPQPFLFSEENLAALAEASGPATRAT